MIQPDGEPLYRQVARQLRHRITSGEWPPGTELPSEPDLAATYGVGRDPTVRSAIALLRAEGLLDVRRGYRSKVRQQPEREQRHIPAGTIITGRMPTPDERSEMDIPEGVPVFEVGGPGGEVLPADRYQLMFSDPDG